MNFQIQDTIDPAVIRDSADQLNSEMIVAISEQVVPHMTNLSPGQFLFLMANLSSKGTNFEKNIVLIDHYLKQFNGEENLMLELERALYNLFIKRYETQEQYNEFFKIWPKHYQNTPRRLKEIPIAESIAFFVHAPVFLAHTNPMFKLLTDRKNKGVDVTIVSLGFDPAFAKKCHDIGVSFINISAPRIIESYRKLIAIGNRVTALIWQCLPVHLGFVTKHLENVVWWSHKFHPGIPNVACRIGGDPACGQEFSHFDYDWKHFDVGFYLENENPKSVAWGDRQHQFASFCREELIDFPNHWMSVRDILRINANLKYCYTGRRAIHNKWCEELGIPEEKIEFLGWLDQPHAAIRHMAFLLDGPKLGHGLMAFEAIAARVPVLSPNYGHGAHINFLRRNKVWNEKMGDKNLASFLSFDNVSDAVKSARSLLEFSVNQDCATKISQVWACERKKHGNFEHFLSLFQV